MEVHMEFMMKKETLSTAVFFVDKYLSRVHHVPKSQLQLIGVTSMHLASKLEEILSPRVQDFVKSTDNAYTKEQIN